MVLAFFISWLFPIFLLATLALPIVALVDILRNTFKGSDKIIWVGIVIFLSIAGSILYFIIGSKQKIIE